MGENSKIEWTTHTFNPWRGCTKVSPGCANCYADTMSGRNPKVLGVWGKNGTRVIASEAQWKLPVRWNREAAAEGVRKRVFCASLADVFEGNETLPDYTYHAIRAARIRLFELIDSTPHLDWLLLTKRPHLVSRILDDISNGNGDAWSLADMPNVWLGTTIENQEQADERIPELLEIPAKVRFLSVEPLLGPVRINHVGDSHAAHFPLGQYDDETGCGGINWVIVGGESGPKARPMHPDWVRSLHDQCVAAGVPFFFKQQGEWQEVPKASPNRIASPRMVRAGDAIVTTDGHIALIDKNLGCRLEGQGLPMRKIGKHKAGRLLDGREWNEMPEVA